jgi:acyl-CoA synthetase (AMP-forming)/AMP-acid ligase II
MIISGGLNIYPGEVEEVIYQHASVAEVGVIGVPDSEWGEAVKACVVLKKGHQISERELIEFCKERLSGYKAPKSIDYMQELPHTATGKIMYPELRKRYPKADK